MNRRAFVAALGALGAIPFTVQAEQAAKVYRIGSLAPAARASIFSGRIETVKQGLRDLGWIEGRNLHIEYRWAEGRVDRLPTLAEELVRLNVDLIIAWTSPAALAVRNATRTIPVVMASVADPIASGLINTLARPGGNMTGVSLMAPELAGKHLELLRSVVSGLSRVAFLSQGGDDPASAEFVKEMLDAGRKSGIDVQPLLIKGVAEFDAAFTKMLEQRVGAVAIQPFFVTAGHGRRIADLAVRHHLATISDGYQFAEAGGLIYYGPDRVALDRLVPAYVDRILKGAKPADLPVEQPTKFELLFNLKTAKALGLTNPPSLLARADQIIE